MKDEGVFQEGGIFPEPKVCRDATQMLMAGGRGVEVCREPARCHLRLFWDLEVEDKALCVNSCWNPFSGTAPRFLNHSAFLSHLLGSWNIMTFYGC